jgi:hypothetical protein
MRGKAMKVLRVAAIALVALELLYLLVANLALSTGLVRKAISAYPDSMLLTHGRAYTIFPGRANVSDLSMRVQDRNIQFLLTVDQVRVDVDLVALLRRRFNGSRVRCEGVSFRFVHRVGDAAGMEARLAAYPPIPGLARPALFHVPPPPEPTKEEIDALWTVRLDDVDVGLREIWFLEHRWEGAGRATGRFELSPVRRLRVGPAELTLDGGELRAGPHVVSKDLHLRLGVTVEPFDVQSLDGMQVFRPVSGTVRLEAKDFSPALLALYVPGLTARGAGSLVADLRLESGRLGRGARVDLKMVSARAEVGGFVYEGAPQLTASFDPSGVDAAAVPVLRAEVPGFLVVPISPDGDAKVEFRGLWANATLSGHDLTEGIVPEMLTVRLEEARVVDARDIGSAVMGNLPLFFVPPLLGDGPLIASVAVDRTRGVTIARLRHARLGVAEIHGAARTSKAGWDGAASGHFGFVPIGVRLKDGRTSVALFVSDDWLDTELSLAGIRFETIPLAR